MTKKKVLAHAKAVRKRHRPEFKQPALLRAVKDGVSVTARDLGLDRCSSVRGEPRSSSKARMPKYCSSNNRR